MESVNFGGDNPQPRFGHTICVIAPNKIALFGGKSQLKIFIKEQQGTQEDM